MRSHEPRASLLGLRERYLWLWRQLQKLEQKLKINPVSSEEISRSDLWAQRMKQQLKRYWP